MSITISERYTRGMEFINKECGRRWKWGPGSKGKLLFLIVLNICRCGDCLLTYLLVHLCWWEEGMRLRVCRKREAESRKVKWVMTEELSRWAVRKWDEKPIEGMTCLGVGVLFWDQNEGQWLELEILVRVCDGWSRMNLFFWSNWQFIYWKLRWYLRVWGISKVQGT